MHPVRNAGGGKSGMRVVGWELQPEGLAEGRRTGGPRGKGWLLAWEGWLGKGGGGKERKSRVI